MYKYTQTYQLLQHTPLIHFQRQQIGATLRATEVKPKFDDFLIKKIFNGEKDRYRDFLVGGPNHRHSALDYRLTIRDNIEDPPIIIEKNSKDYPMFFANMGKDYKELAALEKREITISIFCLNEKLGTAIEDNIGSFFACTNFGLRSSKGYGSFTVKNSNALPKDAFHFTAKGNNWSEALENVELFYKSIRGGINGISVRNRNGSKKFYRDFYMKPLIFQYAIDNNIQWEKKTIKEKFFNNQLSTQQRNHHPSPNGYWPLYASSRDQRIVRDLLGLSTEQTWKDYPVLNSSISIKKNHNEDTIQRFASPIIFKPIFKDGKYEVYFWANPIPAEYLDATFNIEANNESFPLKMWKEFDVHSFLKDYIRIDYLNKAMRYDANNSDHGKIAELLRSIYKEIQKNSTI